MTGIERCGMVEASMCGECWLTGEDNSPVCRHETAGCAGVDLAPASSIGEEEQLDLFVGASD